MSGDVKCSVVIQFISYCNIQYKYDYSYVFAVL